MSYKREFACLLQLLASRKHDFEPIPKPRDAIEIPPQLARYRYWLWIRAMSYQPEPGRGPNPSAGGQTRYHHGPINGRAEFPPEKHGKASRDAPILPPSRPNQDKQARRKRRLISIEGQSVVVPIYFLLPILCILVYVPIGKSESLVVLNEEWSSAILSAVWWKCCCPRPCASFSAPPLPLFQAFIQSAFQEKTARSRQLEVIERASCFQAPPQICHDRKMYLHFLAPLTFFLFFSLSLLHFLCLLLQFWRNALQNARRVLLPFWRKDSSLYIDWETNACLKTRQRALTHAK